MSVKWAPDINRQSSTWYGDFEEAIFTIDTDGQVSIDVQAQALQNSSKAVELGEPFSLPWGMDK